MIVAKGKYEVHYNHCNCHPETCSCNDWAISFDGERHSTYFSLEVAKEVAVALNAQLAKSSTEGLFVSGVFSSSSGITLDWKIECDALTDKDIETLANVIARRVNFSRVVGVPTGGLRLATALKQFETRGPFLIVDDVLTTGGSMERTRAEYADHETIGVVLFARRTPPSWIKAVFTLWS